MKTIIFTITIIIIFFGCSNPIEPFDTKKINPIGDNRLNGIFDYSYHWIDSDGIEEINENVSMTFDGTTKAIYYNKFKNYTINGGWNTSPDFGSSSYYFTLEIMVNNTKTMIKHRQWYQDKLEDWSEWGSYSFNGNVLTINIYNYTHTLTKK